MQRREGERRRPRPAPTSWETDPERSRSPQPRRSSREAAMGSLAGPRRCPSLAGPLRGRGSRAVLGAQGDTSNPAAPRERWETRTPSLAR